MSIDLEWDKLDASLATTVVDLLNRQLVATTRPSFIGPIEVTSLDFGSAAPDVELVNLRDIYRDFLEDDEDEDELSKGPVKVTENTNDEEEGFEWVSRRAARREEGLAFQQQRAGDMLSSVPTLHSQMDIWNAGIGDFRRQSWPHSPMYRSPSPFLRPQFQVNAEPANHSYDNSLSTNADPIPPPEANTPSPVNQSPNLQMHFQIHWQSNLRITLTTSLLINYPSPIFMSLPIRLSVTGLVFTGEVAVAYEGERKRIHLCILDDLDPYGPRQKRHSLLSNHSAVGVGESSTPPDIDEPSSSRPSKPPPAGQRLLPSIDIESEIGQADKHVLKNVTRVERFIQDVIRKTVEEELVFPNFHTLLMGDQDGQRAPGDK